MVDHHHHIEKEEEMKDHQLTSKGGEWREREGLFGRVKPHFGNMMNGLSVMKKRLKKKRISHLNRIMYNKF